MSPLQPVNKLPSKQWQQQIFAHVFGESYSFSPEEACTVGITTQRRHHQGFRSRRTGREVSEASSICQTIYRTIGRAELTQTDFSCKKELPHQEPLTPMPDNILLQQQNRHTIYQDHHNKQVFWIVTFSLNNNYTFYLSSYPLCLRPEWLAHTVYEYVWGLHW